MKTLLTAASLTALLMAAPAWAESASHPQNAPPPHSTKSQSANPQKLSSQDKEFIKKAGAGNLAEAALGVAVQQKASNAAVKEFGTWMATDHAFANKRLMAIAEKMHAWQPPKLTPQQQKLQEKLEGLSGPQFDREYMEAMVKNHKKAIQAFQKEAQKGENQQLKAYAKNLVPVLEQHLAEAQELAPGGGMASGMGPSAGGASGSSAPHGAKSR